MSINVTFAMTFDFKYIENMNIVHNDCILRGKVDYFAYLISVLGSYLQFTYKQLNGDSKFTDPLGKHTYAKEAYYMCHILCEIWNAYIILNLAKLLKVLF